MRHIIIDLSIAQDEWLKIYRGQTNLVRAVSRDGKSIQFPANILSPYVSHSGVHGSFVIYFGDNGKFQSIEKL